MGGLISNIILIVVSVFHYVILPANALSHHEQRQVEGKSRSSFSDPFKIVSNSLPFNKYAFLTTHDASPSSGFKYSGKGRYQIGRTSKYSVTQQLNSGVRALMLNIFTKAEDVWLCQECDEHDNRTNDFEMSPALDLFQEVEELLTSNPSEIVTLFLKDEVETPNGLAKAFNVTGLTKYKLPLSKMARYGGDWPRVKDMVAANQRLVVFSSAKTKEESEGIGYQGNFVVEYQYGSQGMDPWTCAKRDDVSPLKKKRKSLVLLNYLPPPDHTRYTEKISKELMMNAIRQCHTIDSDNWANFIYVDYGAGIDVGPAFEAVDFLNGKLLCGCDDVNSCRGGSWCPSEAEFGIKTKVIVALLITCIVLGCTSRIVRYIKKQKYKLKK